MHIYKYKYIYIYNHIYGCYDQSLAPSGLTLTPPGPPIGSIHIYVYIHISV